MELAQEVYQARKRKSLTQENLAEQTNLSLSTIKRIEKGKVTPRTHTLKILSEVLQIELLGNRKVISQQEDNNVHVLTSMFLLFLPPLNIIYLLVLNSMNRKKMFFNSIGRKMLIFQMSSFIIFLFVLLSVISLTYLITGHKIYGQINSPFILYVSFIIINILVTLFLRKEIYNETTLQ